QRQQAVEPLDQDVELERRDEPGVAERPNPAREAPARGAHQPAPDDERGHERRPGGSGGGGGGGEPGGEAAPPLRGGAGVDGRRTGHVLEAGRAWTGWEK